MKRNFALSANNDIIFGNNGQLMYTQNNTEWLAGKLKAKLQTYSGEWFANQSIGLPFYADFMKKRPSLSTIETILSDVIRSTEGVDELVSFETEYNPELRTVTYSFVVKSTAADTIVVSGALL